MTDEQHKAFIEHLTKLDHALDIFCNSLTDFHIDLKTLLFQHLPDNKPNTQTSKPDIDIDDHIDQEL